MTLVISFLSVLSQVSFANDYQLGLYELNRGEFKSAKLQFEPLAAEGYSPAQYQLAMMYKNGQGVAKDLQKAFDLLTLASNQNDSDAQFDLAIMYSEGEVVAKDLQKAFELTAKSATKGLASAQFNLGVMYYDGTGTSKDYLKASRWYQKAADQNYALAQFNLALMYFEGQGVEKSTEMSYIWNTIAGYNGYADAIKSRDMDANKLSKSDVEKLHEKADVMYQKIVMVVEAEARKANEDYKKQVY